MVLQLIKSRTMLYYKFRIKQFFFEYKVIGKSYVLRIELFEGAIKIDAFEDGDIVPMADR